MSEELENKDDFVKFDDEVSDDKKKSGIEDEISKIFKSADSLIEILEKISPQINSDKVVNPEAFL